MTNKKQQHSHEQSKVHVVKTKRQLSELTLKTAALGIAVLIAISAVGIWYGFRYLPSHRKTTSQQTDNTALDDMQKGNFTKAQQVLKSSSSANSKQNLLLQASAALGNHQYKQALQIYQTVASKYGTDASTALDLGQAAQLSGNTQAAITYYQQAETLYAKQNDAASKQTVLGVQQIIKQLQS